MTFQGKSGEHGGQQRKAIAIVGSGAAALGAAWALAPHHDVTLFDKNDYAGGHAHTVDVIAPDGSVVAVDTGFIVYNLRNYPNLVRMFSHLGIETQPTTMGFAVSLHGGALEYSGGSLGGLLAQKSNLLKPRFLGMISDILRFNRQAPKLLEGEADLSLTLGAYLTANGYGRGFIEDHILPMAAAIWSAPTEALLAFPAISFVRFFKNHGLLSLSDRPEWRTVTGGSRRYVARLLDEIKGSLRLASAVTAITRREHGVEVATAAGVESFDEVVLAAHADEALALLSDPTPQEVRILGSFRYETNRAWLHSDERLMPRRRVTWSAWNYLGDRDRNGQPRLAVSYWMNELQRLPGHLQLFVTLNPPTAPDPARTYGCFDYDHPIFDCAAMAAQSELGLIQGKHNSWFCGSWCGYGFHEDAFSAGLRVAEGLGCLPPWTEPMVSVG